LGNEAQSKTAPPVLFDSAALRTLALLTSVTILKRMCHESPIDSRETCTILVKKAAHAGIS